MTSHHSDILLPRAAWGEGIGRTRLAAFVPITVALIGVAAILSGGITARSIDAATVVEVDPVTTGSVMTADQRRRALEMLDR
jgi:hypothetical protein